MYPSVADQPLWVLCAVVMVARLRRIKLLDRLRGQNLVNTQFKKGFFLKFNWKLLLPHGVVWLGVCVTMAAFLWWNHLVMQKEWQVNEQATRRELSNLSRLSQEHARRTFYAADQALQLVRTLYLRDGMKLDLAALVRQSALDTGIVHQVGIMDAYGIYRLSNWPATPPVDLSDRAYFKVHVVRAADELFISAPEQNQVSGKWMIQLTRRIQHPDGVLAGVAMVSVDVDYFSDFYASLDLGEQGVTTLAGLNGEVLARRSKVASGMGIKLGHAPAMDLLAQGQREGFFEHVSPIDRVERLHHYRQVTGFPLFITVAFGLQEYRAYKQSEQRMRWGMAALGSVLLLSLSALFSWHRMREQRYFHELQDSHEHMNLTLDSGGVGLWEWDLAQGHFWVDERLEALLGFHPGEMAVGNSDFMHRLHPDDTVTLNRLLSPVLKGDVPQLVLEHRLRHKDGHWVWLTARGKVVRRGEDGRALRMVGTDVDRTEQKRLEEAARQSQDLLQNLTDQVPAELFQFKVHPDGHSCYPYASKHFLDFYGLTLAQVQSDASLVSAWQHPDDVAMIKQSIIESVTQLTPWKLEYRLRLPDGRVCWRNGHAVPQKMADGSVVCYGVIFDVTERKLVEQELSVAAVAFESSSAMVVSDSQQRILRVNQAFVVLTGYAVHEAVGRFSGLLNSGRQDAAFYQAMWQVIGEKGYWEGEIWNRRQNGDVFLDWLSITVVKDAQGCVTNYVSVHSDITLRKRTEEEVHKLAFFDPLTNLPNRRLLQDRLQQLCAARARNNQLAAVLFVDLDRFKQLNDTHGHDQGDDLLIQVAQRLQACVREVDTVARLGGDEFVVVLAQLGEELPQAQASALRVAQKILKLLAEPFDLPRVGWTLSASIGVTMVVEPRVLPEDLLKQADGAMYVAKAAGRNAVRIWGVV